MERKVTENIIICEAQCKSIVGDVEHGTFVAERKHKSVIMS
jgi:hypothetical protein